MAGKTTKNKPDASASKAASKSQFATRVGNGSALHVDAPDGRGLWARRAREVYGSIVSDLGGAEHQSELSSQTIRRCVGLILLTEQAEAKIAAGDEIDISTHIAAINSFNRTANALGLARVARDITPDLNSYLAARAAQIDAEAEEADTDLGTEQNDDLPRSRTKFGGLT